jgi:four helix bundle protein
MCVTSQILQRVEAKSLNQRPGEPGIECAARMCVTDQKFEALRNRVFRFPLDVVRFCRTLPDTWEGRRMGDQRFRAGTSVGANYYAAAQRRSDADFVSKMGRLALLHHSGARRGPELEKLAVEVSELVRIFGASLATAKANARRRKELKARASRRRAPE